MNKEKNFTVRIQSEAVCGDECKVQAILDRVSRIIGNAYIEEARTKIKKHN